MNVTYIIGNGFDLNLDLKTSYQDFYEYYRYRPSPNDDIKKLKDEIQNNVNQWSDLEYSIGQYTRMLPGSEREKMIEIILDLAKNLKNYLIDLTKSISIEEGRGFTPLSDDLENPDKYLTPVERNRLIEFYNSFNTSSSHISIITLNYTLFIEKLLGFQTGTLLDLPTSAFNGRKAFVGKILHLHENLEHNIIVGVNDESQIANEAFRADPTLREFLIKPVTNQMFGTGVDYECEYIIDNTNLFILFGVSLGDTDKKWWEKIANRLQQDEARMIIFHYDKDFRGGYFMGNEKRSIQKKFLDKTSLDEDWRKILQDRIFIAPNTDMFKEVRQFMIKEEKHLTTINNPGLKVVIKPIKRQKG